MGTRKIILVIILLPLLAALALYFHYTRQFDRQLQRMASNLAVIGSLEWQRVWIHPGGEVRVNQLTFTPHEIDEPISIERIAFRAPNLLALIQSAIDLDDGRLPESMGMNVRGLRAPLEGSQYHRQRTPFHSGLPFEAASCGGRDHFTARDLAAMDYFDLAFDLDSGYELIGNGQAIVIRMSTITRNLAGLTASARFRLDAVSRDTDLVMRAWSMARLEEVELVYHNLGFRERVSEYCSQLLGVTPEQYQAQHVEQWIERWKRIGLIPGEETRRAYRRFIDNPEELRLSARPRERLPLTAFTYLETADILGSLNLSLAANRQAAVDMELTATEPVLAETEPEPILELEPEPEETPAPVAEAAPETAEPATVMRRWTEVSKGAAAQHVSAPVRLRMRDGSRVDGQLIEVDSSYLHVRIRNRGGFFVRPYPIEQIESLRVML